MMSQVEALNQAQVRHPRRYLPAAVSPEYKLEGTIRGKQSTPY